MRSGLGIRNQSAANLLWAKRLAIAKPSDLGTELKEDHGSNVRIGNTRTSELARGLNRMVAYALINVMCQASLRSPGMFGKF